MIISKNTAERILILNSFPCVQGAVIGTVGATVAKLKLRAANAYFGKCMIIVCIKLHD